MNEDRPSTDGGETAAPLDAERAGDAPPDPPTNDGLERVLPDLLDGVETVSTVYLVRASLASGSGRPIGERLVGALEDKVTVVGSTLDAGFDPPNPELDVLVETDHDHGAIAASLASVGPVEGVVVADVTAATERELDGDREADGANANDVFNELKDEVGQEGYGTVVDELEDVSFPGGPDPDEEVDLEEAVDVELSDEEPESIELEGGDDGTLDLGGGDGGPDDEDEITTKQLLGEEERDGDEVKAPDEKAIEEAIQGVELDAGADVDGDDEGDAPRSVGDAAADDGTVTDEPVIDTPAEDGTVDDGPADDGPVDDAATDDAGTVGGAAVGESTASGGPDAAAPGAARDGTPDGMDAFVAGLVQALESGAIDDQRRTELREALGIESTHSMDVRLEYLQKRVDNLAAYTDAWEAFLSEQGSGREFMESMRDGLENIEDRLDGLEGDGASDGVSDEIDAVEDRLDAVESTLANLEGRYDEDVARLDTRIDSIGSKLSGRLDTVEDAISATQEKVSSLLQWREHVDDVLGSEK